VLILKNPAGKSGRKFLKNAGPYALTPGSLKAAPLRSSENTPCLSNTGPEVPPFPDPLLVKNNILLQDGAHFG
jgi:hypothetical protein